MRLQNIGKIFGVVVIAMIVSGCGGGGGNSGGGVTPPTQLDNSLLADGENQYGYFGTNVIFGDSLATGEWTQTTSSGKSINFELLADGTIVLDSGTSLGDFYFDYGISKDGQELTWSVGEVWYITGNRSGECYNADWVQSDGDTGTFILCKK